MSSLRVLLGYDPKDIKPSRKSATPTSVNSNYSAIMTTKKTPFQVSMSKVKRLPPISEEGTPRNSPRPTLGHITLKRLPKQNSIFKPTTSKPVIPVKPTRKQEEFSEFSPPPSPKIKKKADAPVRQPGASNANHTIVDGLVSGYLHSARYGHIIPMYEGIGATTCPCCVDRNRQNVRTLLGFPGNVNEASRVKELPQKYDKHSSLEPKENKVLRSDTVIFPNSMYAKEKEDEKQKKEPTEAEIKLHNLAQESQKRTWMSYQPLPYSTNYLNPEFHRPYVIKSYLDELPSKNYNIAGEVVQADSEYQYAMNKLERLAFGSRS